MIGPMIAARIARYDLAMLPGQGGGTVVRMQRGKMRGIDRLRAAWRYLHAGE